MMFGSPPQSQMWSTSFEMQQNEYYSQNDQGICAFAASEQAANCLSMQEMPQNMYYCMAEHRVVPLSASQDSWHPVTQQGPEQTQVYPVDSTFIPFSVPGNLRRHAADAAPHSSQYVVHAGPQDLQVQPVGAGYSHPAGCVQLNPFVPTENSGPILGDQVGCILNLEHMLALDSSSACSQSKSNAQGESLDADLPPQLGSIELPSVGSLGHNMELCKPCAFVNRASCANGSQCIFCHLCDPGEKKRRRKDKRAVVGATRKH